VSSSTICEIQFEKVKVKEKVEKNRKIEKKDTCLEECPSQKCVKFRARIPSFL